MGGYYGNLKKKKKRNIGELASGSLKYLGSSNILGENCGNVWYDLEEENNYKNVALDNLFDF